MHVLLQRQILPAGHASHVAWHVAQFHVPDSAMSCQPCGVAWAAVSCARVWHGMPAMWHGMCYRSTCEIVPCHAPVMWCGMCCCCTCDLVPCHASHAAWHVLRLHVPKSSMPYQSRGMACAAIRRDHSMASVCQLVRDATSCRFDILIPLVVQA